MANFLSVLFARVTTAQHKAEFKLLSVEAERLNENMRQTRIVINQLEAETKLIRDEIRSLFNGAETEQQAQRRQQRESEIIAREQENQILRLEYVQLCTECNPPRNPDERLF